MQNYNNDSKKFEDTFWLSELAYVEKGLIFTTQGINELKPDEICKGKALGNFWQNESFEP